MSILPENPEAATTQILLGGGELFTSESVKRVLRETNIDLPEGDLSLEEGSSGTLVSVPRSEYLRRQMNHAAYYWAIWKRAKQPPASKMLTFFKKILKHTDALLELLNSVPSNDEQDRIKYAASNRLKSIAEKYGKEVGGYKHNAPNVWKMDGDEFTDYNGDSQYLDVLENLVLLNTWSKDAVLTVDYKGSKGQGGPRRTKDEALHFYFHLVIKVYKEVFERHAGTSTRPLEKGKGDGPLVRFALEAVRQIGYSDFTQDAVRSRLRDVIKSPPSNID